MSESCEVPSLCHQLKTRPVKRKPCVMERFRLVKLDRKKIKVFLFTFEHFFITHDVAHFKLHTL